LTWLVALTTVQHYRADCDYYYYLNDRAKSIVSKLTPDVAGDYSRLKDALLHEFKLSPNTYLERFNSCHRSGEETFVYGRPM